MKVFLSDRRIMYSVKLNRLHPKLIKASISMSKNILETQPVCPRMVIVPEHIIGSWVVDRDKKRLC